MGKHWWRIVHIYPKTEIFLFDSFGVESLRNFIVQDNKKRQLTKCLHVLKTWTDDKPTLVKTDFSTKAWRSILTGTIEKLSTTAQDFFHFAKSFGKLHGLQVTVSICMLEGLIQKIQLCICRSF